jgi:hypothetical protein
LQTAWGKTPHSPKALKTYNKAQEITSKSTSYNNTFAKMCELARASNAKRL